MDESLSQRLADYWAAKRRVRSPQKTPRGYTVNKAWEPQGRVYRRPVQPGAVAVEAPAKAGRDLAIGGGILVGLVGLLALGAFVIGPAAGDMVAGISTPQPTFGDAVALEGFQSVADSVFAKNAPMLKMLSMLTLMLGAGTVVSGNLAVGFMGIMGGMCLAFLAFMRPGLLP